MNRRQVFRMAVLTAGACVLGVQRAHGGSGKCTKCKCDGWSDVYKTGRCNNAAYPGPQTSPTCSHTFEEHA